MFDRTLSGVRPSSRRLSARQESRGSRVVIQRYAMHRVEARESTKATLGEETAVRESYRGERREPVSAISRHADRLRKGARSCDRGINNGGVE